MKNRTYRNNLDRESIVEHTLCHNSTKEQQRFRGSIDFLSPSRQMIQKENCSHIQIEGIQEDAIICSNILVFLLVAQKASSPKGISRSNCCTGLRVYSSISYHVDGKTYKIIGEELGDRKRQIPERYALRFHRWSNAHCEKLYSSITPDEVICCCHHFVSEERTLNDVLDTLRIALVDLLYEAKHKALHQGVNGIETFSGILGPGLLNSISKLLEP